jgi:diaminopimelate decarboxylase
MNDFHYQGRALCCESTPVAELADQYGTPLYVYSARAITDAYDAISRAFAALEPLVCYSVKANGNLSILKLLAERGSGFDVVSGGELERVRRAVGRTNKVVFAGVGKSQSEIAAGIEAGVLMFNVESEPELHSIANVARRMGRVAPLAFRVNPDVDPHTHRYTSTGKKESKFGMDIERSLRLADEARGIEHVSLIGLHMHIGSQITTVEPYASAVEKGAGVIRRLRELGHPISWFNVGGGYGIAYRGGEAKAVEEFARVIVPIVRGTGCRLALEPGRVIVGNAGILVSRVIFTKQSGEKRFVIQDAAMNDLIRPALYESFHRIWPVNVPDGYPAPPADYESEIAGTVLCDVVGPVCESGDFLAKERWLPPVEAGDYLATYSAGAYGMVMASNYNARSRGAEVLVAGAGHRLIRRRETIEDLVAAECV